MGEDYVWRIFYRKQPISSLRNTDKPLTLSDEYEPVSLLIKGFRGLNHERSVMQGRGITLQPTGGPMEYIFSEISLVQAKLLIASL